MNWYIINKDYIKFLQTFDSKVGFVEYGDKTKLHIGVLLEINDYKYYVPISSPKEKHKRMNNGLDFHKLIDPLTNTFYAVINLNNMIPVPDDCVTLLKYDEIENYRSFTNKNEQINYIYLLQKEKAIIDNLEEILQSKAKKLFAKVKANRESSLARRCCDFELLQEKSTQFIK